jgi:hypothetical protein
VPPIILKVGKLKKKTLFPILFFARLKEKKKQNAFFGNLIFLNVKSLKRGEE